MAAEQDRPPARRGHLAARRADRRRRAWRCTSPFVRDLEPYTDGFHVPWWALAAGFAATEVFVIHAHVRGSAHTLSLSEIPLVVGLLLAPPQDLILAQVVGPLARAPVRPRHARRSRSRSTSRSSRSPRRSR